MILLAGKEKGNQYWCKSFFTQPDLTPDGH
jgi:hypothetical protein